MSGDKVSGNLRVRSNDANNTWIACVEFPDGHRICSENMDRYTAVKDVRRLARHHANTTIAKPMISDQASNDVHTNRQPTEIDSVYSDIREQEKVMCGLIVKAKRAGVDGRLVAMANTDFERGFMALDKALTTNKE
ncbi:hypothetical protein ACPESL_06200 [Psychrobacter pocilloporae]|uniref:hypothetical protein n=1 Tax=Psychrobacter pocilloporae TaxID=1775882 RepID=UPI003C2FCA3C